MDLNPFGYRDEQTCHIMLVSTGKLEWGPTPHHLSKTKFAQIPLILSLEWQKIDIELRVFPNFA
jgi:hypothetical protein